MSKMVWSVAGILLLFMCLLIYVSVKASDECEARGGEMAGTGRYIITYVQSGNVMIPMQNEVYDCTVN